MEIFIPMEAEVKKILLWSLPNSVLRKMGLPLSNAEGCRTFPESPEGIWISPVVLRRKGQKHKSLTGSTMGSMSSVIGAMSQVTPVPYPISFVSSCDMAYKVLKDTMPGQTVPFHSFHISELLVTPAPHTHQDAVIIYQGRVYLSIRRPCQTQHLAQTCNPQCVSMASITSTTDTSSKSKKHTQASLEPPNMEIQRPYVASKHSKEDSSTRYEEHLHDNNTKNKIITWKGTCSKAKQDIASSMTAWSAIQCTDWVDDVRCKQSAEQVSVQQEALIHLQREQKDNEIKLGGEQAENVTHNSCIDTNIKTVSRECVNIVGFVAQCNNQSWTGGGCEDAASTLLQQKADYKELAQEEEIARLKAKLRQSNAALSSLQSSEQQ